MARTRRRRTRRAYKTFARRPSRGRGGASSKTRIKFESTAHPFQYQNLKPVAFKLGSSCTAPPPPSARAARRRESQSLQSTRSAGREQQKTNQKTATVPLPSHGGASASRAARATSPGTGRCPSDESGPSPPCCRVSRDLRAGEEAKLKAWNIAGTSVTPVVCDAQRSAVTGAEIVAANDGKDAVRRFCFPRLGIE